MVEFTNRESVEAWCETRSIAEIAVFAAISAARLIPLMSSASEWKDSNLEFTLERALLSAFVRGCFDDEFSREASVIAGANAFVFSNNHHDLGEIATAATSAAQAAGSEVVEDAAFHASAATFAASGVASESGAGSNNFNIYSRDAVQATYLEEGGIFRAMSVPLWGGDLPEDVATHWKTMRDERSKEPKVWRFWIDWYEGLLEGRTPDWELWREVALIPNDVWEEGPEAVAEAIEGIKRRLVKFDPFESEVEAALIAAPKPATKDIEIIQKNITKHRADLPPTFDAIEGYIALEIERLQKDNYLNSHEPEYVRRSIETLLTLSESIAALRATIPATGPISTEVAERSARLFAVYKDKFKKLPVEKADEVVEGVWQTFVGSARVGLIFASTSLGGYLGVPPHLAFAGGAMAFAPKQASDLIKAAKEAFTKST